MPRPLTPSLVAFMFSATAFAQAPGSNDATFSPLDHGHGIGDPSPSTSESAAFFSTALLCITTDPSGRTIWAGKRDSGTGFMTYVERRNADGSIDPSFSNSAGANNGYGEIDAVAAQADGKILIGGAFYSPQGTYRYNLIRLNTDGGIDPTFYNNTNWGTGTPVVRAIAIQPDGQILLGGTFSQYGGSSVANLTRLNMDGTRDVNWFTGSLGGTNGAVHAIRLQPNGRVLIAGDFTQAGGVGKVRIARFDPTNISSNWWDSSFSPGTGCNAVVRSLALQPDGNILIGGDFTIVNGIPCERIARLTSGGVPDGAFTTSPAFNGAVRTLSLRADGSVLACGDFSMHAASPRNRLAMVSSSGGLLATFDPGTGSNGTVFAAQALSNGKAIAVGSFTSFSGVPALRNIRLDIDGGIDETYSYNGSNGRTKAVLAYDDGRILVGGEFSVINGALVSKIARLFPDGSVDDTFVPGVGAESLIDAAIFRVNELVMQPDGRILVAGLVRSVTELFGTAGYGIARMDANGALDPTFTATIAHLHEACALSLQIDGKIIAADHPYSSSGGFLLKRYNADGSLDGSFAIGTTASGRIERTAVLPDGKVMVIGGFVNYAGSGRNQVVRLNSDGSVDATFNYTTGFTGGVPKYILVLSDGKCIVSGSFTAFEGNVNNGLCRLNADGTFDPGFAPTVNGGGPLVFDITGKLVVSARYRLNEDGSTDPTYDTGTGFANALGTTTPLAIAASLGGIVAVGDLTSFNGTGRNRIARVTSIIYSDITLPVRALLEGPFVSATNLMNDGLRAAGVIPTTEPFNALGFTHVMEPPVPSVSVSVFNPTVPVFGSIVDWVMVELRSATNPAQVVQTRTGLIQRDGDIVGVDGVSPLVFNQPLGNYYVAVRHRNHTGCMTATPIALSTTNAMLNFSLPTTATYGTEGQKASGTRMVLWAGDATHNGTIKYTGSVNDRDPILVKVGSTTPNAIAPGYFTEDVNMDGTVKYTGSANDRDPILVNVGSTTPNNVRGEQLP